MKSFSKFIVFSSLFIISSQASLLAQDITGTWQGRVFFMGQQLRIVFHIKQDSANTFTATMDSPDQGSIGNKVDDIELNGDSLYMYIPELNGEFTGVFLKDTALISGYIKQDWLKLPLKLRKGDSEDLLYKRPQKPVRPYPYSEEEVSIINQDDSDTLSGTFTKPNGPGKFPVAVLISGSGPQDRNETILGHQPFLVLADFLTRMGFAVLRCDDRGTAKSTGSFKAATSDDFASDVEAQVDYLKTRSDIDVKRIGLIGHSEGGVIAPMVAAKRSDVAYVVLMAALSIDMFDLLLLQDSLISVAEGISAAEINKSIQTNKKLFEIVHGGKDSAATAELIDQYLLGIEMPDGAILKTIWQLCSPWMRWYVGYNPQLNLEKLHCAVLAVNGEKDVQVPAQVNINYIERALMKGGNKNFKTAILPGLNHLFQVCKKCSVSEYIDIEHTIDPSALNFIGDWMEKNFLKK